MLVCVCSCEIETDARTMCSGLTIQTLGPLHSLCNGHVNEGERVSNSGYLL
jgi:hypothetical protein